MDDDPKSLMANYYCRLPTSHQSLQAPIIHLPNERPFVLRKHLEAKDDDEHVQDHRVDVVRQEGRAQAAEHDVNDGPQRDQKARRVNVHPGQVVGHRCPAEEQHGRDDHVGDEAEAEEGDVGGLAVAGLDDFRERVGLGGLALQLDGEDCEQ